MANYVMTYSGGSGDMPTDPAEVEQVMAAWGAWYGTMGDAVVDGGAPFSIHTTVTKDGTVKANNASTPLTGYTIVKADSIDAASEMAKGCPVLEGGGIIQVSETVDMG